MVVSRCAVPLPAVGPSCAPTTTSAGGSGSTVSEKTTGCRHSDYTSFESYVQVLTGMAAMSDYDVVRPNGADADTDVDVVAR